MGVLDRLFGKGRETQLSEEQRQRIYLDFIQAEEQEREGPPIEEIMKGLTAYPGGEANAIARAVVSQKMVDPKEAYARALHKVAAKHHLSEGELESILAESKAKQR